MKNFTKLLCLILVLSLSFALVGCKKGAEEEATDVKAVASSAQEEEAVVVEQDPVKIAAAQAVVEGFLTAAAEFRFDDASQYCVNPDGFASDGDNKYDNDPSEEVENIVIVNSKEEKIALLAKAYIDGKITGETEEVAKVTATAAAECMVSAMSFDYEITSAVATVDGYDITVALTLYNAEEVSDVFTKAYNAASASPEVLTSKFAEGLKALKKHTATITLAVVESEIVEETEEAAEEAIEEVVEEATEISSEEATEEPEVLTELLVDYANSDIAQWNDLRS